ncbi:hypothetical protein [Methanoculleus chikugoensis]|uniref:hypothetical protein n=1 Tax=Methanoculleus chikugoensis TaxID=118126 RepID=UPI000A5578C2|nr:hypothetical protein [Methanoculleus chikugoensis]
MEEDKNPKSRNRLKTAALVVACGLAGVIAIALGLMLADALIIYAHESSGEQPMFYVMERAEPGGSVIVPPLTEQDFEQHPPELAAVIRGGEERNPSAWEWGGYRDQRVIGGTKVSYTESKALHDAYGPPREGGRGGCTRSWSTRVRITWS